MLQKSHPQVQNTRSSVEGGSQSHQTRQTGQKPPKLLLSAQQLQSKSVPQSSHVLQRSIAAVLVCCRDDDVHPNPHGDGVGGHQEEETVVRLDAEGQTGPRRLRGGTQTAKSEVSRDEEEDWRIVKRC